MKYFLYPLGKQAPVMKEQFIYHIFRSSSYSRVEIGTRDKPDFFFLFIFRDGTSEIILI